MAGWFCERDQKRKIKENETHRSDMDVDKYRQEMAINHHRTMNLSGEMRERMVKERYRTTARWCR
ncbi:hypothetical protein DBR19_19705 [Aeromonas sp. HMWF014]|jgi:hypothetical protein|nr:hypothetical protein DBR19_19705 [Aeromonas sp. HMWF014]